MLCLILNLDLLLLQLLRCWTNSGSSALFATSGVIFVSSGLDKYRNSLKTLYNLIIFKLNLSTNSVSRKQLILDIGGKVKLNCDLKRHLSPRTVGVIMRSLPLEGNSHLLGKSIVYFETNVDAGIVRVANAYGDVSLNVISLFAFLLVMYNLQKLWPLLENFMVM